MLAVGVESSKVRWCREQTAVTKAASLAETRSHSALHTDILAEVSRGFQVELVKLLVGEFYNGVTSEEGAGMKLLLGC